MEPTRFETDFGELTLAKAQAIVQVFCEQLQGGKVEEVHIKLRFIENS